MKSLYFGFDPQLDITGNAISYVSSASALVTQNCNLSDTGNDTVSGELAIDRPQGWRVILVLYNTIGSFCFFGNLLVFLASALNWKVSKVTRICLVNLAFADLLVGVFCIYQSLLFYIKKSWMFGDFLCKMYRFTHHLNHMTSVPFFVLMFTERYLAIVYPLKNKLHLSPNQVWQIVGSIWITSAIFCSPHIYYAQHIKVLSGADCSEKIICTASESSYYDFKTLCLVNFFLLFLLPLLVIAFFCTRIKWALSPERSNEIPQWKLPWKTVTSSPVPVPVTSRYSCRWYDRSRTQSRSLNMQNTDASSEESSFSRPRSRRRARAATSASVTTFTFGNRDTGDSCLQQEDVDMKNDVYNNKMPFKESILKQRQRRRQKGSLQMLLVMSLVFVVCQFPVHLKTVVQLWWPDYYETYVFSLLDTQFLYLLLYTNSAIKPIIYAFMSKTFISCIYDVVLPRLEATPFMYV